MSRKLFCQISPFTYRISTRKCQMLRNLSDWFAQLHGLHFAAVRDIDPLPVRIYQHQSLIRRKLGQVDMTLQENKAVNLSLAAPLVNGILIRPGETFSFWRLVGDTTEEKGYKTGLTITGNAPSKGPGGGMCQFTNLIHWMILHSPLTIVEHHHHDGLDLFPDFGRQIPFGTGTSILYNYKDYRFRNDTPLTYQLLVHTGENIFQANCVPLLHSLTGIISIPKTNTFPVKTVSSTATEPFCGIPSTRSPATISNGKPSGSTMPVSCTIRTI